MKTYHYNDKKDAATFVINAPDKDAAIEVFRKLYGERLKKQQLREVDATTIWVVDNYATPDPDIYR